MKGKFRITAKEKDIITNKGVRAFIMESLLNSAIQKGKVLNIDERTVEVQLEGEKEKIQEFIKELKKELAELGRNPQILFSEFQEDLKLEIPGLMRSSQALTIGQLQKGISVQLEILNTLKQLPKAIEELPEKLAEKLKQ